MIKVSGELANHNRNVAVRMGEAAATRKVFAWVLQLIAEMR